MILDVIVVVLTAAIAVAALVMSVGLVRRDPGRVEDLAAIGFRSPAWSTAIGLTLIAAVVALIIGWWLTALGVVGIVAIKALYAVALIAYRRADKTRDKDMVTILMSAHSVVALVAVVLLLAK